MSSGTVIRDAAEADVEVLAAMCLRLQQHLMRANPDLWDLSDVQKRGQAETYRGFLGNPDKRIVVACRADGQIVGMAMGTICRDQKYEPDISGHLDDVWVSPDHRNAGVCARMVERLLASFEQAEIEHVTLRYAVGNAEAEAVWSRMGFKPVLVTAASRLGSTAARRKRP